MQHPNDTCQHKVLYSVCKLDAARHSGGKGLAQFADVGRTALTQPTKLYFTLLVTAAAAMSKARTDESEIGR